MKKTYRKVITGTLKGSFSRFAAIAAIVALGVGLLSGLLALPIDMRRTVDHYFDRQHLHDLHIVSMLGMTDDDVKAISEVEGIDEVMPAYMTDVFIDAGSRKNIVTRVHGLPSAEIEENEPENYLNRIDIIDGRLPLREGECVVVDSNLNAEGGPISIGTVLTLSETNRDLSETLAPTEFKVVGIARTSYYFSVARESATIGDGTVALKIYTGDENFLQEAYSEIFATVEGAAALGSETQAYRDLVDETAERVEEISDARCTARYYEVKDEISTALSEARAELSDARAEADEKFADAEQQLAEGEAALEDAEKQLDDAEEQIESGKKELADNKAALPGTLQQQTVELAAGKAALAAGKQQLADTEAFLKEKRQELAAGKEKLAESKMQLNVAKQLIAALEPSLIQAEANAAKLAEALPPLRQDAADAQSAYDAAAGRLDLAGKEAAAAQAGAEAEAARAALKAAQQTVTEGMAAAGCESEAEWLVKEPEKAAATLAARNAAQTESARADAALASAGQALLLAQTAIAPAKSALDAANTRLAAAQGAYDTAAAALEAIRTQLDSAKKTIAENEPLIAAAEAEIAAGEKQLADGEAQLAAAKKQIAETEKILAVGESSLDIAPLIAQMQMDLAQAQLDDAQTQYDAGLAELESGRSELEKNEAEYLTQKADAEQQLADAEQQIRDGEEQLAGLEVPVWMVLDRSYHASASSFLSDVDKLEAITTVFPVFFFLVAALVALTTMTRMVDEERLQIGTFKALGYRSSQIMFKYLFYAWFATLIGGAAGIAFGFTVIPIVIWNAYGTMYTIPDFHCLFHTHIAVIGVGAALLCTSIATWNACSKTLREWAARLLLPKAPAAGKRILLERIRPVWKRMKFTHKVTARNLFRYKKRFFMTVIGVAGCTALLVTGFGLKDSIGDIVAKQFGEIFTYDFFATVSREKTLEDEEFLHLMDDPEQVERHLSVHQERVQIEYDDKTYGMYLFAPEEDAELPSYVDLHERRSGKKLRLTDDGVIITEKFSENTGIGVGDTVTLKDEDGHEADFAVTGVAENYVENYAYMTNRTYEDAFGHAPVYNSVLGQLPDGEEIMPDAFASQLLEVDGIAGLTQVKAMRESLDETIASINYVVYVIILCAGMLAFVVLYNLMNINITERSKEIATIKVLGFYEKEVGAYVFRESNILSLIGMLAGLVGGVFLHAFIMRTVEVDMVMFGHEIKPLSFVLSAVLTIVFAQFVNLVMRRKLRSISMVESMKAPE